MESLEDFDYIIKRWAPNKICFGSTLPRDTLPQDPQLMNSFMRRKNPINAGDAPIEYGDDGPAKCHCRVFGTKGYGALASKVPRFAPDAPKPVQQPKMKHRRRNAHSSMIQVPAVVKQSARPFGRSGKWPEMGSMTPGPGRFTGQPKRKIIVSESFGGRRRLIPAVVTVCSPVFMDACYVCRQQPRGIFWKNVRVAKTLCRYCMVALQRQQMGEKSKDMRKYFELMEFQRARYCDYLHNHHKTRAKIQVIGRQALTNLLRIENYLSMYHM